MLINYNVAPVRLSLCGVQQTERKRCAGQVPAGRDVLRWDGSEREKSGTGTETDEGSGMFQGHQGRTFSPLCLL